MRAKIWGNAALRLSALALAVFVLTHLCVELPRAAGRATPIWLPNALMLACLLGMPMRNGWSLVLAGVAGGFAAHLGLSHDPWIAAGLTLRNAVEVVACWLALKRLRPQGLDPADPGSLRLVTLVAAAGAALCVLVVPLALKGWLPGGSPMGVLNWWAADVLGIVIFVPCLLILGRARHYARDVKLRPQGVAALLLLTAGLLTGFGQTRYPLMFLIPPLFMLVSLELEMIGAAAAVMLFAMVTVAASLLRMGPANFIVGGATEKVALMQLFIAVSGLSALGVAAIRVQQRRLREALVAAHDEARERAQRSALAEDVAGVSHWRLDVADDAVSWSPGMYKLFGVDRSEPVHRSLISAMVHPDDRASLADWLGRLGRDEISDELGDTRIVRRDGEVRYVRGRTIKERGPDGAVCALFGTLLDVTEQRLTAMAIAESEERFRTLAENTSDALIRISAAGELLYASPAYYKMTGFNPEEEGNVFTANQIHPDELAAFAEIQGRVLQGDFPSGAKIRHRRRRKDGSYIWLEGRPRAIYDDSGRMVEVIDIIRNVSDQVQLETELRAARDEAEAATVVKSQFLSNMSHELRTPLTAVLGFSSLLSQQPDLNPAALGYVRRLETAGKALLAIINDVLDFSKLEAGRLELAARAISPAELVRDTVELFTLDAEAKGVALAASGLDALPPLVLADPDRLRQILLNLVGNAVKFTDAGEVRVTVRHQMGRLEVAVDDTGPGISPSQRTRLFQRFSQIDGSSTRRHGGSGLGLAICKGLVEAMEGEIGVRARRGGGSSFWFAVPAAVALAETASATEPSQPAPTAGLRLLVADDHPVNRQLARAILEPLGVEVEDAVDGRSAIEAALSRPFDLILMDIRMPEINGASAMQKIRRSKGPNRSIPILAFSAEGGDEALEPGFDGRVAKPLSATELIQAVARFTDPQSAARQKAGAGAA